MKGLQLAAYQSEIRQRIRNLSAESSRQWGKMTAGQMVCHLTDGFQMATGERPVQETSSLRGRTGLKCIALDVPLPWAKGFPTFPEADAFRDGTRPTEFARDLERLERSLQAFAGSASAGHCGRHPFFGALSPNLWLRWGYLHADHHLRQLGA